MQMLSLDVNIVKEAVKDGSFAGLGDLEVDFAQVRLKLFEQDEGESCLLLLLQMCEIDRFPTLSQTPEAHTVVRCPSTDSCLPPANLVLT